MMRSQVRYADLNVGNDFPTVDPLIQNRLDYGERTFRRVHEAYGLYYEHAYSSH
jgi:hypothetical protein